MKKILITMCSLAVFCFGSSIFAEVKIGVLDLNKVMQNSPQVSATQAELKKQFEPRSKEIMAKQEDIKLLLKLINPKYYIPIYGTHTHIQMNAEVARSIGMPKENVLISKDGEIIEFDQNRTAKLTGEKLQMNDIYVDGLGIGDVSGIVIRDRKQMSEHGMLVIISTVDRKTGKLVANPDIISRGFIYMNANKKLVEEIRSKVIGCLTLDRDPGSQLDDGYVKEKMRDEIGKFIYKKTHRTPMILPVILEV